MTMVQIMMETVTVTMMEMMMEMMMMQVARSMNVNTGSVRRIRSNSGSGDDKYHDGDIHGCHNDAYVSVCEYEHVCVHMRVRVYLGDVHTRHRCIFTQWNTETCILPAQNNHLFLHLHR
jgi:hypothetical protein